MSAKLEPLSWCVYLKKVYNALSHAKAYHAYMYIQNLYIALLP